MHCWLKNIIQKYHTVFETFFASRMVLFFKVVSVMVSINCYVPTGLNNKSGMCMSNSEDWSKIYENCQKGEIYELMVIMFSDWCKQCAVHCLILTVSFNL